MRRLRPKGAKESSHSEITHGVGSANASTKELQSRPLPPIPDRMARLPPVPGNAYSGDDDRGDCDDPGGHQENPRTTSALHEAAVKGQTQTLLRLLNAGAAINGRDASGAMALHLAIREANVEAASLLLARGADVEAPLTHSSVRPIHLSALSLSPTMMSTVLRYHPDPETRASGVTALYYAISTGSEAVVRLLLEAGADATARTLCVPGTGESVLHMAVGWFKNALLPLLIAYGADVNATGTNPEGEAALHVAAKHGNAEAIAMLIDAGADISARSVDGWTPLGVAAAAGHVGSATVLVDRGGMDMMTANTEPGSGRGRSPLFLAALNGKENFLSAFLCGGKLDVGRIPERLKTDVAVAAAGGGHLRVLQLLHDEGFPILGRNFDGESALEVAASFGHKDVVVYLLRQGADPRQQRGPHALSSFDEAILQGHFTIVELLQEAERQRSVDPGAELFPGWRWYSAANDEADDPVLQAEFMADIMSLRSTRRIRANQDPGGAFNCDKCKDLDFRRGMHEDAEVVFFVGSIASINSSAFSDGCRGCRFLVDCLKKAMDLWGQDMWASGSGSGSGTDSLPLTHLVLHSMSSRAPLLLHLHGSIPHVFPSRRLEIYVDDGDTSGATWPTVGTGRDVSSSPYWSPKHAELARSWVRECITTHNQCRHRKRRKGPLPTRVIRVGSTSTNEQPRLYLSSGEEHEEYVALSHCWGGVSPIDTRTETLAQRTRAIGIAEMPKTFRDAVTITRSLGIQYLWIDSLCILQDSDEDWRREAARMKDVYANCYAMIAADDSPNPHGGCFPPTADNIDAGTGRNNNSSWEGSYAVVDSLGPWFSKVRVRVRLTHVRDPFHMEICHRIGVHGLERGENNSAAESLTLTPRSVLNQRGWCLQERVLAPRVLHFGRSEVAWECPETIACECQGTAITGLDRESRFKALLADHVLRQGESQGQVDILLWTRFVEEFTRRQLTKTTDILHALSGLASHMAAVARAEYVCGIWKTQIAEFLLWRVDYGLNSIMADLVLAEEPFRPGPSSRFMSADSPVIPKRHESYYAPSWSWASVIAPVTFLVGRLDTSDEDQVSHVPKDGTLPMSRWRRHRISLLDAVHFDYTPDPLHPFGPPIGRPAMTISGQVVPVTWLHKGKNLTTSRLRRSRNGGTLVYTPPTASTSTSRSASFSSAADIDDTQRIAADFEPDLRDEDLDVSVGDSLLILYVIADQGPRMKKGAATIEGIVLAPSAFAVDSAAAGGRGDTAATTIARDITYRRVGTFELQTPGQEWLDVASAEIITIV